MILVLFQTPVRAELVNIGPPQHFRLWAVGVGFQRSFDITHEDTEIVVTKLPYGNWTPFRVAYYEDRLCP